MKLGAENRTTLMTAVVLLAVAVVLGARFVGSLGGGSSSAAAPPATIASAPAETLAPQRTTKGHSSAKKPAGARSLDPTLRFDLLKASEETKYEGTGRDVFRAFVEPPPRLVAPVVKNQPQVPTCLLYTSPSPRD